MKYLLALTFCIISLAGSSQTSNHLNSWWTYSGNHRVSAKNSIHTLYSLRRNGPISNWQQSLLRLGLNHEATDNFTFTLGYDWVVSFPYGEQPIPQKITEHRITTQAVVRNKISNVLIKHRYRFEQRYIGSTNTQSRQRLRYRLILDIPLKGKVIDNRSFFLSLFNETFINVGNRVENHIFDQNWVYGGLGYKIDGSSSIKIGYMNQYIVKGDNNHRENNHTIQASISKNFNFLKSQ